VLGGSGACEHAGVVLMAQALRRRPKAARPEVFRHRRRWRTRGRLSASWMESPGPNAWYQRRA
jgi:hypothetical protein